MMAATQESIALCGGPANSGQPHYGRDRSCNSYPSRLHCPEVEPFVFVPIVLFIKSASDSDVLPFSVP